MNVFKFSQVLAWLELPFYAIVSLLSSDWATSVVLPMNQQVLHISQPGAALAMKKWGGKEVELIARRHTKGFFVSLLLKNEY